MNSRTKHIPVRLSGLADGTHESHYEVAPGSIDLPEQFRDPVIVNVRLDKATHQIAMQVQVRSTAMFPCDRCLEDVVVPVEKEFVLVYTKDKEEQDSDNDDLRVIDMNDPVIDLTDDVRDAALLCIPMRIICGDTADGEALCRQPIPESLRAESLQREDPRWEALKSLNLKQ
jgi:uncharacterized protein